jgi:hypothetical protein
MSVASTVARKEVVGNDLETEGREAEWLEAERRRGEVSGEEEQRDVER